MKNKTFGDFPKEFKNPDQAKIALLPIPYDGTSTYGKGADKGPDAILAASYYLENLDLDTGTEVYKHGIYVEKPVKEKRSPEKMTAAVEKAAADIIAKGKFYVGLGGEHSVTPGAVYAHAKKYQNLSVLQLDAHTDMREEYHGSKNNHACAMARVKDVCPVVQVGIRSVEISEYENIKKDQIFYAKDIHNNDAWMDKATEKLTENVFITIDLDVFDPAIMPSTGTPEPGGLGWYQVLTFLRKVTKEKNVVGFDIVELAPKKGVPAPDFFSAKLVYTLLSYVFAK